MGVCPFFEGRWEEGFGRGVSMGLCAVPRYGVVCAGSVVCDDIFNDYRGRACK